MVRLIHRGSVHPLVRAQAEALVQNLPERNKVKEAQAIYNITRQVIRYTDDPVGLDTLKSPEFVLQEFYTNGRRVAADCMTQSTFVGALARSLRIPVRLRVIGDSQGFYHVHPELAIDGFWRAADVTAASSKSLVVRELAKAGARPIAEKELLFEVG